jgi:sortase A
MAFGQEPTATISIPAINVQSRVVEIYVKAFADGSVSWDTSALQSSIGHLEGTAWFGESGNTVLGGHSELSNRRASVFASLDQLQIGDVILVDYSSAQRRYSVTGKSQVETDDLSPVYPTPQEQLTLITCDTSSFVGNDTYAKRLIVIARPIP